MEKIKAGTMGRTIGKRDMVFCLIYTEVAQPYRNYDYFKDVRVRQTNIPLTLTQE